MNPNSAVPLKATNTTVQVTASNPAVEVKALNQAVQVKAPNQQAMSEFYLGLNTQFPFVFIDNCEDRSEVVRKLGEKGAVTTDEGSSKVASEDKNDAAYNNYTIAGKRRLSGSFLLLESDEKSCSKRTKLVIEGSDNDINVKTLESHCKQKSETVSSTSIDSRQNSDVGIFTFKEQQIESQEVPSLSENFFLHLDAKNNVFLHQEAKNNLFLHQEAKNNVFLETGNKKIESFSTMDKFCEQKLESYAKTYDESSGDLESESLHDINESKLILGIELEEQLSQTGHGRLCFNKKNRNKELLEKEHGEFEDSGTEFFHAFNERYKQINEANICSLGKYGSDLDPYNINLQMEPEIQILDIGLLEDTCEAIGVKDSKVFDEVKKKMMVDTKELVNPYTEWNNALNKQTSGTSKNISGEYSTDFGTKSFNIQEKSGTIFSVKEPSPPSGARYSNLLDEKRIEEFLDKTYLDTDSFNIPENRGQFLTVKESSPPSGARYPNLRDEKRIEEFLDKKDLDTDSFNIPEKRGPFLHVKESSSPSGARYPNLRDEKRIEEFLDTGRSESTHPYPEWTNSSIWDRSYPLQVPSEAVHGFKDVFSSDNSTYLPDQTVKRIVPLVQLLKAYAAAMSQRNYVTEGQYRRSVRAVLEKISERYTREDLIRFLPTCWTLITSEFDRRSVRKSSLLCGLCGRDLLQYSLTKLGVLANCDDLFCYPCIRSRSQLSSWEAVAIGPVTCPVCRVQSPYFAASTRPIPPSQKREFFQAFVSNIYSSAKLVNNPSVKRIIDASTIEKVESFLGRIFK